MQTPKPIEPGCIAVIVKCSRAPTNVGKTVQVIRGVAPGHHIGYGGYPVTNTDPEFCWVVEAGDLLSLRGDGQLTRMGWALIPGSSLRRIDDYEPEADDLELYDRHGQLENKSQCQNTVSKFTTRASLCAKA